MTELWLNDKLFLVDFFSRKAYDMSMCFLYENVCIDFQINSFTKCNYSAPLCFDSAQHDSLRSH